MDGNEKLINRFLNLQRAHEAVMLLSDTRKFIKNRAKVDESLVPSLLFYGFCKIASVYLISRALSIVDLEFESKISFIIMGYIFIPFLALTILAAWFLTGVKFNFYQVNLAILYIQGLTSIITSIGVILFFSFLLKSNFITGFALYSILGILIYWELRSWRALAGLKRHSRRQLIVSFILFQIIYLPVMWMFWSMSTIMGRAF